MFTMPACSGDIRDQSRKLSQIAPKFGRHCNVDPQPARRARLPPAGQYMQLLDESTNELTH